MRSGTALALLLGALATGCGGDGRPTAGGELRVFAAASLAEAFTELGKSFELAHPRVRVRFTFAASSALAQQLRDGAPADVFVSADERTMASATAAGTVGEPRTIARNRLSIVVEPGNPKGVGGLADLDRPDVVLVLCAPAVPCGRLAAAALDKAGVDVEPASLEENVKGVLSKVALGEADAGIVYVTDARAARGDTDAVAIDVAADPELEAAYTMAAVHGASDGALAAAWTAHVLSPDGQATLARFGFLSP